MERQIHQLTGHAADPVGHAVDRKAKKYSSASKSIYNSESALTVVAGCATDLDNHAAD